MPANISIYMDDQAVMQHLANIIARGKDTKPVMAAFGDYKVKETITLFEREHDPDGRPWPALSRFTLKTKRNTQILTESTDLRNSIFRAASRVSVRIGTNKAYAAAHQFGLKKTLQIPTHRRKIKSRNKKGVASGVAFVKAHERRMNLPERRFLGFTAQDEQELANIVKDWLKL